MFTSDRVRIWVGRKLKLKGIECQRRLWVCNVELFEGGLIAFPKPFQADDKKGALANLEETLNDLEAISISGCTICLETSWYFRTSWWHLWAKLLQANGITRGGSPGRWEIPKTIQFEVWISAKIDSIQYLIQSWQKKIQFKHLLNSKRLVMIQLNWQFN